MTATTHHHHPQPQPAQPKLKPIHINVKAETNPTQEYPAPAASVGVIEYIAGTIVLQQAYSIPTLRVLDGNNQVKFEFILPYTPLDNLPGQPARIFINHSLRLYVESGDKVRITASDNGSGSIFLSGYEVPNS